MSHNPVSIETPNPEEIVVSTWFDAQPSAVFDALTRPDLLARWIGTNRSPVLACESEARVGGSIRYLWEDPAGGEFGLSGVWLTLDRPGRLVRTEIWDDDWTLGEAIVTTLIDPEDGGARVRIRMRYASEEARDTVLASPMIDGMEEGFERLARILSAPAAT